MLIYHSHNLYLKVLILRTVFVYYTKIVIFFYIHVYPRGFPDLTANNNLKSIQDRKTKFVVLEEYINTPFGRHNVNTNISLKKKIK